MAWSSGVRSVIANSNVPAVLLFHSLRMQSTQLAQFESHCGVCGDANVRRARRQRFLSLSAATKTETNNKNNKDVVWDLHITSKSKRNNKVQRGRGQLCKIHKAHDSFIISACLSCSPRFVWQQQQQLREVNFFCCCSSAALRLRVSFCSSCTLTQQLPNINCRSLSVVAAQQLLLPAIKFAVYLSCYLPTLSAPFELFTLRSCQCPLVRVFLL